MRHSCCYVSQRYGVDYALIGCNRVMHFKQSYWKNLVRVTMNKNELTNGCVAYCSMGDAQARHGPHPHCLHDTGFCETQIWTVFYSRATFCTWNRRCWSLIARLFGRQNNHVMTELQQLSWVCLCCCNCTRDMVLSFCSFSKKLMSEW